MAANTIIVSYSVGLNNNPIKLKVSLSNSLDIGRSTVRIDKGEPKKFNDSFELSLGNADDLIGSKITIDTTETNIDKTKAGTTNFLLELTGGSNTYSNLKSETVAAGDAVLYTAEITLLP